MHHVSTKSYGGPMTHQVPWEPPLAGTETEHLFGALNRLRMTFLWKADDLDADGLQTTIGASSLTLGGLLKHLALVETRYASQLLDGSPLDPPWDTDWDGDWDWPFSSAVEDTPEQLYRLYEDAVERCRIRFARAIADGGIDQPAHVADPEGNHANLRRLVCDLIEEYGRHTGHADLLREQVDGRVGEDPPLDWRPRCASGVVFVAS